MKYSALALLSGLLVFGLACCGDDEGAPVAASAPDASLESGTAPPPAVTGDGGSDAAPADAAPDAPPPPLDPLTCDQKLAEPVEAVFTYVTTGSWEIVVDGDTVTITNPTATDKVECWGESTELAVQHENLNGKHIKDWKEESGGRRTFLLPDGTTLTLRTCPAFGPAFLSIYDGAHTRRVAMASNEVLFSSDDASVAATLEASEADGEAARLFTNENDGMSYENVHLQGVDAEGRALPKVPGVELLGETGGPENPNFIIDYYDDPRWDHT